MTAIGKLLAFVSLILSIASLGVAMWLTVDKHDWKKELEAKKKELDALYPPVYRGDVARDQSLVEASKGERTMTFDAGQQKTIAEARASLIALDKDNGDRLSDVRKLLTDEKDSREAVIRERGKTENVLKEVDRLSRLVTPEKPDEKGIPARIEELHKERRAADEEHVRLYPEIANGEAAVELLQIRNAELKRRLDDLQKAIDKLRPRAEGPRP